MSVFFSGRELVDIAVGIERRGVAFYDTLVDSTKDARAKDIYRNLADQEREHMETFGNMLGSVSDYSLPETYSEENDAYLKALVDSTIFPDDQVVREMAQKVSSDAEAIQIAIGAEKESILFYMEMRDLVRRSDREVVNKIIGEERSHLRQLSGVKKGLSKP
ncbi:MAG: ferritin family protein [Chloroflexi bacterium]|nr:ferritin family protein [Chloroflexota bacterium]